MKKDLNKLGFLKKRLSIHEKVYVDHNFSYEKSEIDFKQTANAFSVKWDALEEEPEGDQESWKFFQKEWYLKLYGFEKEDKLRDFLQDKRLIIDAGCGKGYKAAWFAELAPQSTVLGMDISTSIFKASRRYAEIKNLYFIQSDIANTPLMDNCTDFISCDQVIHHTPDPPKTLSEFRRLLKDQMFLCNYVYAKKALPRELVDEHFRSAVHGLSEKELWSLSEKLTTLGKLLSDLNITLDFPDIKELGIRGGKQDLQRFVYWNFIKCFWNEELGREASVSCNFDWYAPSIAYRYSLEEFLNMSKTAGFEQVYLHQEEACHSGLFKAI